MGLVACQWTRALGVTMIGTVSTEVKAEVARAHGCAHTIVTGGVKTVLHVIPAGIMADKPKALIGPGTVIDPVGLIAELDEVEKKKPVKGRLFLSDRAHLILEYNRYLEKLDEQARGKNSIGTTLKGVGPTYADKANRIGIRAGILNDEKGFRELIARNLDAKNQIIVDLYKAEPLTIDKVIDPVMRLRDRILPLVADTTKLATETVNAGGTMLLEGNQGILLDIDHGTYPYVSSSSCVPSSGLSVFGLAPAKCSEVIGIVKAYQTRVGRGPMPTIQDNETGELIRQRGNEYGASTGRPRHCGWLDLVALRYSVELSGVTQIAITMLDVLGAFKKIKVCSAYRLDDKLITSFPGDAFVLDRVAPIYDEVPGWESDISSCRSWNDLPQAAKDYVEFIETFAGVPVRIVSVGPDEVQTIRRN
ncbi:MAG: adenylosuccinate synthase [Caldiserica bacterium]|nr:adenylosuccinate synthase [Caldisericota bacterium]